MRLVAVNDEKRQIDVLEKENNQLDLLNEEQKQLALKNANQGQKLRKLASLFVDIRGLVSDLFEEINFMRNNPKEYAKIVENHMQYIFTIDNQKIYEHGEYKVMLRKGEEAFRTCIDILSKTKTMKSFEFVEDVKLVCPDKIDDQPYYEEPLERLREKFDNIRRIEFNYDIGYPKPEIINVLQLVDDNNTHNGRRRNNLLNEDFKHIGISIKKSKGKQFCIYLTFSN